MDLSTVPTEELVEYRDADHLPRLQAAVQAELEVREQRLLNQASNALNRLAHGYWLA